LPLGLGDLVVDQMFVPSLERHTRFAHMRRYRLYTRPMNVPNHAAQVPDPFGLVVEADVADHDAVSETSSLVRISDWMVKRTFLNGKNYSFKDHEYQVEIVNTQHPNTCCIKPSQVGMSEAEYRMVLGLLDTTPDSVALLLMPTVHEAQRQVKSRIDPIIQGSRHLSARLNPGSDSASFKQIGTSQLHVGGTYGKAVISIPCSMVIVDERDFCNPEALVTAESRLSHAPHVDEKTGLRGFRREFSTPTASGIGVSESFEQSDQKRRLVKCKHCGHWFWPNLLVHGVIPGFDNRLEDITYLDVRALEAKGHIANARILCEKCHNPVTKENLAPEYREWVPTYPERYMTEGFAVSPFDLPEYHSASTLLRKLIKFKNEFGHWKNFTLGLSHDDASNSILDEIVKQNMVLKPIPPEVAEAMKLYGCIAGLDVGKTSWLTIGKPVGRKVHILWVEPIRLRGENGDGLKEHVLKRLKQYGVIRLVSDALPYTDTILGIRDSMPDELVYPCMYTLTDKKLPAYVPKEKEGERSVDANRTKTLNRVAKRVNGSEVLFPILDEMETVRDHLQGMKRVDQTDERGEVEQNWIKSSRDDHYFHSLNYLLIAADMVEESLSGWAPVPSITQIEVGKKAIVDKPPLFSRPVSTKIL